LNAFGVRNNKMRNLKTPKRKQHANRRVPSLALQAAMKIDPPN
jgi:hypothetical protein